MKQGTHQTRVVFCNVRKRLAQSLFSQGEGGGAKNLKSAIAPCYINRISLCIKKQHENRKLKTTNDKLSTTAFPCQHGCQYERREKTLLFPTKNPASYVHNNKKKKKEKKLHLETNNNIIPV